MYEVVYLSWPRCCILSNVLLTRHFGLIHNVYSFGLIVETLVFHPGFRCTFTQYSRGICTKPEDFQIERSLSTKRMMALMTSFFPQILISFRSSIFRSLADKIEISLQSLKMVGKIDDVDITLRFVEVTKQFLWSSFVRQPSWQCKVIFIIQFMLLHTKTFILVWSKGQKYQVRYCWEER